MWKMLEVIAKRPLKLTMIKNSVSIALTIILLVVGEGLFWNADAAIPGVERDALIALFNDTDGDNWTDNSGWKEPPLEADGFAMLGTENTWYGITCDGGNTTVLRIIFNNNNLSGTIPAELGNLSNLNALSLSENQLTGSIPVELGNLTNLAYLAIAVNQLTGNIPTELGNLTNLKYFYLNNNQLTGTIPLEIGNLTNLESFWLSYNQITGSIPVELGNLASVQRIILYRNQLTGSIPATSSQEQFPQN
ncbi:MAG: leucine-rich repeat domain-containing protein [Planctomycetota bacterium]|jgi:hypothetical protein